MEVNKEILNLIKPDVEIKDYEEVFVCCEASLVEKKTSYVVLLVTDFCFYLLKKASKKFSIICQIQWHTLQRIIYIDKTTFSVTDSNSNTYKVGYKNTEDLLKKLFDFIENTLLRDEKPEYVNCQSILSNIQHLPTAFLQRFKYKLRLANEPQYPEILAKELTKIVRRQIELDISALPSADRYTGILLNCCQIEPTLKSVIIPRGIKRNYWAEVAECLQTNTTLNSIKTNDTLTEEFANVAKALSKNKNSGIVSFLFSRSNITPDHFKYILQILQSISFNKLSFENAITAQDFYSLMDYKGIAFAMTSLQSLTFKGIKNLSVKNFLSQIPSLREVTLVNCDTNVDELFAIVPDLSLEVLLVHGGSATSRLITNIQLPATLYSISIENVKWNGDSMNRMWKLCIEHLSSGGLALKECCQRPRINLENKRLKEKEMVVLSFAYAKMTDEQWSNFFMSIDMKICCNTIAELNWSGNRFEPEILHFMMNCSNLHVLVADGIFSPDCPVIQDFTDFLNKFNKITVLSIRGTNDVKLGAASQLMFHNLRSNKKLRELDVCNNDLEDDGLADLCSLLLKNKRICKVRFENNEVQTGTAYYSFFEKLKERGTKLDIIYPDSEIYAMHKANLLDGKSVNYILHCYEAITSLNDENLSDDDDDDDEENDQDDIFIAGTDANLKLTSKASRSSTNLGSSALFNLQDEWTLVIPPVSLPETAQHLMAVEQTYNTPLLIQRARSV